MKRCPFCGHVHAENMPHQKEKLWLFTLHNYRYPVLRMFALCFKILAFIIALLSISGIILGIIYIHYGIKILLGSLFGGTFLVLFCLSMSHIIRVVIHIEQRLGERI